MEDSNTNIVGPPKDTRSMRSNGDSPENVEVGERACKQRRLKEVSESGCEEGTKESRNEDGGRNGNDQNMCVNDGTNECIAMEEVDTEVTSLSENVEQKQGPNDGGQDTGLGVDSNHECSSAAGKGSPVER